MSNAPTRPFIRALLIDISGNLHVGSRATPDAVEAFRRLRKSGIPFRLCSNTSKESTQSLVSRLNKLGFNVPVLPDEPSSELESGTAFPSGGLRRYPKREVWTSIGALAQYVRNRNLKRPFLLLSPSAKEEVIRSNYASDPHGHLDMPYDSVIVGLAPDLLNYSNLNTAFRILKGEEGNQYSACEAQTRARSNDDLTSSPCPPLIATHKAKYIQTENPPGLSLGPGPFVSALESAAGVEAHVIGKPAQTFFQTVINDFFASGELEQTEQRGRIAVIGDDVEADLGDGAVQMELWRILVKTGKYRDGDERRPGITPPDELFDSFSSFVDSLLTAQPPYPSPYNRPRQTPFELQKLRMIFVFNNHIQGYSQEFAPLPTNDHL
ncbi:Haloacid dehalogenase-like hydrolase domain-containing protein 2 [Leucoagaricus sp. SymC.cos]|nr:Haloacid dehalogenase-like hydrolase domain-containing protein 2 [Leucoagaricus sp. SymC.cos]